MANIEVILNISPEVGKAAIVEWAKNKNSLLLLKSSLWKISLFCFASRYRRRPAWVTLLTIRFCALKIIPRHVDHSFRGIYRILWDLRVAQRSACSQLQCTLAAISKEPHILFIFGPPICSKYSCLHHYNTTAATTALFLRLLEEGHMDQLPCAILEMSPYNNFN